MTRWRTGRKLGRTIYLQKGDEPSDEDKFLGIMDDPELARIVVGLVNHYIKEGGIPK
jgi:hypothetical protein